MTVREIADTLSAESVEKSVGTAQPASSSLTELVNALPEKPSRAELLQATDRVGLAILLDCRAIRARLSGGCESLAHLNFDWKDLVEGAEGEVERRHAIAELHAAEAGLGALGDAAIKYFRQLAAAENEGAGGTSPELVEVVERLSRAPAGFVQRLATDLRLMEDDPGLAEVIFRARRSLREERLDDSADEADDDDDDASVDDEVADDKGGADADQVHLPEGLEPFLYSSTERYIANARDYGGGFSEDIDICKVYISACVGEQEQYIYRRSIAGGIGTTELLLGEINRVLTKLHLADALPPMANEQQTEGHEGAGVSAAACGASAGREACGEPMMLHLCAQSGTSTEGVGESLFDLLVPETLIAALHSEIAQFAARWVRRCADQQLIEIGIGNEAAEAPEK